MNLKGINPVTLIHNLQVGIVVHNPATEILYANDKALSLLRLSHEQVMGKTSFDDMWQLLDKHRMPMAAENLPVNRVLSQGKAVSDLEVGVTDGSTGDITWLLCSAYPEFADDGTIEMVVVNFSDITLQKDQIPFRDIVEEASDVVIVTKADKIVDDGPQIVYVNKAFSQLTEYSKEEVLGKTPRILQKERTSSQTRDEIRQALSENRAISREILNYSKSGRPYWLELNIVPLKNSFGDVTYFAAIERDISSQVQKQKELTDLAEKDPLTGLLNRRGFTEKASALLQSLGEQRPYYIALMDMDYFKRINDNYGHDVGDAVLRQFARAMQAEFRGQDVAARFGGEEFVVLLNCSSAEVAVKVLERFRQKTESSSVAINDNLQINATVSIGCASVAPGAMSLDDALKQADKALYEAKAQGRNRVIFAG